MSTRASNSALGLYLGLVQFFFATTWTLYVIYLPQLAQQAGIARQWVPWILVADQVLFALADVATGFWVDRMGAGFARLGSWILGVTVVSSIAFLALPYVGLTSALRRACSSAPSRFGRSHPQLCGPRRGRCSRGTRRSRLCPRLPRWCSSAAPLPQRWRRTSASRFAVSIPNCRSCSPR